MLLPEVVETREWHIVLEGKPVSLAETKAAVWDLAGFWVSLSLHLTLSSDNQKFNRFIEIPEISPF